MSKSPAATAPTAGLTLSQQDILKVLYAKVRPATLRIEECGAAACHEPEGVGTGFFIGSDGTALTAYHVVFQAKWLRAVTSDGQKHAVKVVGYDDQNDLAVLKVALTEKRPVLPLAAHSPRINDGVLAIGNGGGAFLQPKLGRLLALNANAKRADFPPGTLEISAPLIPGDSGGPVLNAAGEVVGVVSFITLGAGTFAHETPAITAYAVPVVRGDKRLTLLRQGLKRDAPVIGVGLDGQWAGLADLPPQLFSQMNTELKLNLGSTAGAFFTYVVPDSPAAKAGLQALKFNKQGQQLAGDVVVAVAGKRVTNFSEFQYAVRSHTPGETIKLLVHRHQKPLTLTLKLVSRAAVKN